MTGREYPPQRIRATVGDVAEAFRDAARDAGIEPTAELVGVLLAQSALETGHWLAMYNFNFGNVKATPKWIENGGGFTYYDHKPPHADAPVSEWLPRAQADHAMAVARPRTDGGEGLDAKVVQVRADGHVYMLFWPSHEQARFRAFESLTEGAKAYLSKLTGRYRAALEPASRGDVRGYVTALRARGYFTAGLEGYVRAVQSLFGQYLPTARLAVRERPMASDVGAFRSAEDDLTIHPSGWEVLSDGTKITRLPVWDDQHDQAARLGFGPMSEWLAAQGMRLPIAGEMEELHTRSLFVAPVTMWRDQSSTRHMMSEAWARDHDAEVQRRLHDAKWDGATPVANFGKHWIEPIGTIYGWWEAPPPSTKKIQNASTFHQGEPLYVDYATTSHAVELTGTARQVWLADQYEGPDPSLSLGQRLCFWFGYHLGIDPREIHGPQYNPLIVRYSEHCRRGGRLLTLDNDREPLWRGGVSLKAPSDEWAWCAIAQSRGLEMSLLPGEKPPHGLRVSVRELVEDARAAGTWRDKASGYVPKPGDAAIEARAGEDPTMGGRGHTRCVILVEPDRGRYWGIGGNEGDGWNHGAHPLDSDALRGWIAR